MPPINCKLKKNSGKEKCKREARKKVSNLKALEKKYFVQRKIWMKASDDFSPNKATPKQALKEYDKLKVIQKKIDKVRFG